MILLLVIEMCHPILSVSKLCASIAACNMSSKDQLLKRASMTLLLLFYNIETADAANRINTLARHFGTFPFIV